MDTLSLTRERTVIEGSAAVSLGVVLARAQVIAAYPITPQTVMVETLADWCATGKLQARFIKVESEHSAMAACVGAASAGARAFTATASQGLAYMHEMLHWAAGARLPIVLANANRGLAAPWTIYSDQSDSISQRDTGWLQFYCESNQEVIDTIIQAYRVAEQVYLPTMVNLDGFFLSHVSEPVEVPDQPTVDEYLPPFRPRYRLDVDDPHTFGAMAAPDAYMEFRLGMQDGMEIAKSVILEADREFERRFGRSYGLVDPYRAEDAEVVLVAAGTSASTARLVVDSLRQEGVKAGLLRLRVFRPFPREAVAAAIPRVRKLAVVDRNCSYGHSGVFFQEIKAALYNEARRPTAFGFVTGLGGRDVGPELIREIFQYAIDREAAPSASVWMGVNP